VRYLPTAAVDSEPQPRLIEAVRVVRQASVSCYGLPRIRGLRYQRITVLASDHELVVEDSPGSLTPVYPPENVHRTAGVCLMLWTAPHPWFAVPAHNSSCERP
jgi:hypothetical protein